MGPNNDFTPLLKEAVKLAVLAERQSETEAALALDRRNTRPADLVERVAGGVAAHPGRTRPQNSGGSLVHDRSSEKRGRRSAPQDDFAGHILAGIILLAPGPDIDDFGFDVGVRAPRSQGGRNLIERGDFFCRRQHQVKVAFDRVPNIPGRKKINRDIGQTRLDGLVPDVRCFKILGLVLLGQPVPGSGKHLNMEEGLFPGKFLKDGIAESRRNDAPI